MGLHATPKLADDLEIRKLLPSEVKMHRLLDWAEANDTADEETGRPCSSGAMRQVWVKESAVIEHCYLATRVGWEYTGRYISKY